MGEAPTLKGRIVATAIGLVLLVAVSEVVLRVSMPNWREFHGGWFMETTKVPAHGVVVVGRAGFDGHFAQNNGDFRVRIRINDFGLRNPDPVSVADGRIWVVGDSMTFGWGVEEDEMYSSVLARLSDQPTYNVASPGADVCGYQALIARMPESLRPRAVVVGLVLENDVAFVDCQKTFRAQEQMGIEAGSDGTPLLPTVKQLLTRHTALYNFFAVALKRVDVVRETLIATGLVAREHAFRPPALGADVAAAADRTAEELAALRTALPAGTPMVVLVVPGRFEVRDGDPLYRSVRQGLVAALDRRGIAVVDPFEAFRAAGFQATHFTHDGHWSPLGHRVAARALADWFAARPRGLPAQGRVGG